MNTHTHTHAHNRTHRHTICSPVLAKLGYGTTGSTQGALLQASWRCAHTYRHARARACLYVGGGGERDYRPRRWSRCLRDLSLRRGRSVFERPWAASVTHRWAVPWHWPSALLLGTLQRTRVVNVLLQASWGWVAHGARHIANGGRLHLFWQRSSALAHFVLIQVLIMFPLVGREAVGVVVRARRHETTVWARGGCWCVCVFQSALQSIQTGAYPCRAHKSDQDKAGVQRQDVCVCVCVCCDC